MPLFSVGAAGISNATLPAGIILKRSRSRSDKNVADTKLARDKFCEQIYPATSKYRRFCTDLCENNTYMQLTFEIPAAQQKVWAHAKEIFYPRCSTLRSGKMAGEGCRLCDMM